MEDLTHFTLAATRGDATWRHNVAIATPEFLSFDRYTSVYIILLFIILCTVYVLPSNFDTRIVLT
jgi:hypothetical protein